MKKGQKFQRLVLILAIALLAFILIKHLLFPFSRVDTYFVSGMWDPEGTKFSYGVHKEAYRVGWLCIADCINYRAYDLMEVYIYDTELNENIKIFSKKDKEPDYHTDYELIPSFWLDTDEKMVIADQTFIYPSTNEARCLVVNTESGEYESIPSNSTDCQTRNYIGPLSAEFVSKFGSKTYSIMPGQEGYVAFIDEFGTRKVIASIKASGFGEAYKKTAVIPKSP